MSNEIQPVAQHPVLAERDALSYSGTHLNAMAVFRHAVSQLDDHALANKEDPESLAMTLILASRVIKDLRVLEDSITSLLWEAMPDKEMQIEHLGTLVKRYGAKHSNWDHDEIFKHIEKTVRENPVADPETGEIDPVSATLAKVRELQSPPNWRKTALRSEGIDPDDVGEVTWGKRSIQITSTNKEWQQ